MNAMRIKIAAIAVALLVSAGGVAGHAQKKKPKNMPPGYDRAVRATVVHPAIVYISADDNAQHVAEVGPGHEVAIMETNGAWVRVFANTDILDDEDDTSKPEFGDDSNLTPASGWVRNKGLVEPKTPNGDQILYGTAANLEYEASQPHAPKDAADGARLLYRRVAEYYPDSTLAPEAAYRSADVRWQLDKADIHTLPSAKEQEAYLRPQIYEGEMQKVM